MVHVATQQLHGRDTDRAANHVGVYQNALMHHLRLHPQDGIENWKLEHFASGKS